MVNARMATNRGSAREPSAKAGGACCGQTGATEGALLPRRPSQDSRDARTGHHPRVPAKSGCDSPSPLVLGSKRNTAAESPLHRGSEQGQLEEAAGRTRTQAGPLAHLKDTEGAGVAHMEGGHAHCKRPCRSPSAADRHLRDPTSSPGTSEAGTALVPIQGLQEEAEGLTPIVLSMELDLSCAKSTQWVHRPVDLIQASPLSAS